jgi:sulfonate transport system substrate-binding protein
MSAHRMFRLPATAAALAVLTVAVAACSSKTAVTKTAAAVTASPAATSAASAAAPASSAAAAPASAAPDLSGVTLHVGATGWNTIGAALAVAGLDNTPYKVSYSVFTGGDKQMQALQAGALDIANASQIPPVFAAANTKPIWKAVATEHSNTLLQEVDVAKGSPITSIAQLKGKKVGYVQNTTAQYFLVKLLQQAGLSWSDITPVPLLPADGVAALNGGSIAAFANYGNSVITILQGGGKTIGSGENILSGNFVFLTSNAVLADPAKSAAAADLLARLNDAYAIIRAGREQQYAQKTADATHEPLALALSQLKNGEAQRPTSFSIADPTAIASEQQVADVFSDLGAIPKTDVSSFWSDALNADLTAALAKYPASAAASQLASAPAGTSAAASAPAAASPSAAASS